MADLKAGKLVAVHLCIYHYHHHHHPPGSRHYKPTPGIPRITSVVVVVLPVKLMGEVRKRSFVLGGDDGLGDDIQRKRGEKKSGAVMQYLFVASSHR